MRDLMGHLIGAAHQSTRTVSGISVVTDVADENLASLRGDHPRCPEAVAADLRRRRSPRAGGRAPPWRLCAGSLWRRSPTVGTSRWRLVSRAKHRTRSRTAASPSPSPSVTPTGCAEACTPCPWRTSSRTPRLPAWPTFSVTVGTAPRPPPESADEVPGSPGSFLVCEPSTSQMTGASVPTRPGGYDSNSPRAGR